MEERNIEKGHMGSSIRRDPFNRNWVIISQKRGQRPNEFFRPDSTKGGCPFCPGNEHLTPPEVASIRSAGSEKPDSPGWQARVFPNLYPALRLEGKAETESEGLYAEIPGIGGHEVIVLTPKHDQQPAEFGIDAWRELLYLFRDRYAHWSHHSEIKYVLIFQNHGRHSGASLSHPHNQLVATPIIPPRIMDELIGDRDYFNKTGKCSYCEALTTEIACGERIVFADEHFVTICPFASRLPYETVLLPRRHTQGLQDLDANEITSLAASLARLLGAYASALNKPPYNYLFHVSPMNTGEDYAFFHWHLEFIPRLSTAAGFEWGSGIFINSVEPAEAARKLRDAIE